MGHFYYTLVYRSGGCHEIIAVADKAAPACAHSLSGTIVGEVTEISSSNPLVHIRETIGLDGLEKVCAAVRKEVRWLMEN